MTTSRTARQKARFQLAGWPTLGSALGLISAVSFLMTLMLASCGLTRLVGEPKGLAMAQYTPNSDTFVPRSERLSSKMPLPWYYHLSRVRDLGSSPQAKLGDL